MSRINYAADPDPRLSVQFHDSLVPTITAGRYTIAAYQTLTHNGAAVDEGYLPTAAAPKAQQVEVRAPRFGVQPDWIHGTYPTPGANGRYDDVLPHVTLTRPTLPWERDETTSGDGPRLPWLALLVLAEGELPADPHCLGGTEPRTVAQLSDPAARLPADAGVVLPAFDQDTDPIAAEDLDQVCRTVLLPGSVFHAVAPAAAELPLLTHVRWVNEQHQGITLAEDLIEIGDYAVVIGNRLPRAAGGRYVAHLVSLEGWQSYLPDPDDETYRGPDQNLRLISLWSWSFETLVDHTPGFAALTEHFVDTEGDQGAALLLRLPPGGATPSGADHQEVDDRLRAGYVPISCRTEAGRATFGWYRGPLIPVPAGAPAARDRRKCAAEALVVLAEYGVFDLSLAAAFTAGRGVALADRQFCAALLRLRGKVGQAARQALRARPDGSRARVEHLVANGLADHLGVILAAPSGRRPAQPVTPVAAATELPATAGLTARRLRGDPELRARLAAGIARLADDGQNDGQGDGQPDDDLTLVRNRLITLRSLVGVPFAHLVADARMLPVESVRFFYVDPEWTDSLLEGALSVGLAHSFDLVADEELFGPDGQAPLPAPAAPITGLLLRSKLVSGWPALEIRPYASPAATEGEKVLPTVRRESLADDVLLVLIEGVPGRVELAEPQQGVHFGIDQPDEGGSDDPIEDGIIRLRSLDPAVAPLGQELDRSRYPFPATPGLRSYVRAPGTGGPDDVLRIARLATGMTSALGRDHALTPSEFAIQMINAAQRRTFTTEPTRTTEPTGTGTSASARTSEPRDVAAGTGEHHHG